MYTLTREGKRQPGGVDINAPHLLNAVLVVLNGFLHTSLNFSHHTIQEADSDHTGEAAQIAQQMLTFYELDLGLNHVVRKHNELLDDQANLLIAGKPGRLYTVSLQEVQCYVCDLLLCSAWRK